MDRRIRTSFFGIAADITLIAIKGLLAAFTGSQALLADAYHSTTDLFVSITVLFGIIMRRRRERKSENASTAEAPSAETRTQSAKESENPEESGADEDARPDAPGYWIEALVAYFVSLIILYVPYRILSDVQAQDAIFIQNAWMAVVGVLVSIAIAYFISRYKIMVGSETDSPGLMADGYHSRMDMFSSVAVLFSVIGQMMGVKLDQVVAVIIAVMIAITGLELFITSIVSFVQRSHLKKTPLSQWVTLISDRAIGWMSRRLTGRSIDAGEALRWLTSMAWLTPKSATGIFGILLLSYLATGMTVVEPNETGVHLRFGKIIDPKLEPGFHYRLPWPIDNIQKVEADRVHRVEVGFRTSSDVAGSITSLLWEARHVKEGYRKLSQESNVLTGDETLLDISLVIHYRPLDAVQHLLKVNQVDEVIRGVTESIIREVVATEIAHDLLTLHRIRTLNLIRDRLQEETEKLELSVAILAVHCHDIHPPLDVVSDYRDVFSAREDRAKLLNKAKSYRNSELPKARAESAAKLSDAEAFEKEKKIRAEGDAQNFLLLSDAYRRHRDVTGYRMYLETIELGLTGRMKIVADPDVNKGGYRMWMFSPGKTPFSSEATTTKKKRFGEDFK